MDAMSMSTVNPARDDFQDGYPQVMPPVRGKMAKFTQVSAEVVIRVRIGTSNQLLTLSEANALNDSLEQAIADAGIMERAKW
jgi:hypothetical protein